MRRVNEFTIMEKILEKHLPHVPLKLKIDMADFLQIVMKEHIEKGFKIGTEPIKNFLKEEDES